jgi:peroxiredoxin
MKKISVLLSILIPFFIQAQEAYTIQGELGMPTRGKIVLHWYNIATGKHDDSADNVDGHFVIKGTTTDKTQLGQLIFHTDNTEKSVLFYLESGTIHIHYAAGAEYAKLSGTPTNNDLQVYNEMLYAFLDSINASRQGQQKYTWYSKEIMGGKIGIIKKFVEKHPRSQVSVDQLNQYAIGNKMPDVLDPIYAKLSPQLQKSPAGVELGLRIKGMRSADVGDNAPMFSLPDTSGHNVSLADFKGKYILIDFWATWCGPCMAEMPNVKKAYDQYKDKGFGIIGVSLDRPDSQELWKKVISRDQLAWIQVSDLKWWNSKAALAYNVNSVPANFLVDPQGKIIAKNLRGEALQKKLGELFQ